MFQHYVLFRNPPKKGGYQKISDSDHDSDLEAVSNGESSEKTPLIDSDEKTLGDKPRNEARPLVTLYSVHG